MTQTAARDTQDNQGFGDNAHVHIAIVGAGFSGLGMAIRLRQRGYRDFVVLERTSELGGTWRDNTYPGCACDVPAHLYSFPFALNPNWSRFYAPQPEIWEYLRWCAEHYGIQPHLRWNCELRGADWDEAAACWRLETSQGSLAADILISGNGPLNEPSMPNIPGLERFTGTIFHSSRWDHDHDLAGERVAVVGTGASSIQFVPQIQPKVERLTLFQRTPPWIMARNDHPISRWRKALFRALPATQRAARGLIYAQREIGALALVYRTTMMRRVEQQSLRHLHAQVSDPELRAKLTPSYRMGCKRILLSDDFYPAVSQPNVEVVTDRIREVREHSVVAGNDMERPVDTIICATGFHVTDMPLPKYVRGRDGKVLADIWQGSPQAYMGTSIAGFPNFFLMIGPNTGLGHTSMVYMIESQITYILDCLRVMEREGISTVEVRPDAQDGFVAEMRRRMEGTVWTSGCASWYLDKNGHNSTLWPGFTFEFRRRTRHFDAQFYALSERKETAVVQA